MNTHLSSEQFDGVLNGQPSQDAAVHLSGCVQCAGELASLRRVFGNLREATTTAAEHHRRFASPTRPRRVPRMAWAVAVAVFVSITAPVVVHRHPAHPVAVNGTVAAGPETISDEALLSSVQNDLSSSVPESLLPLAGTSTNATDSTTVRRKN